MEWMLRRVFDGGRVLPLHVRNAMSERGTLSIRQQEDPTRNRVCLVARFLVSGKPFATLPPLYDVQLLSSNGDMWTLSGHERVISGTLPAEYCVAQSWVLQPAPFEDLMKAEGEWARLSELVHKLQLERPGGAEGAQAPAPPT